MPRPEGGRVRSAPASGPSRPRRFVLPTGTAVPVVAAALVAGLAAGLLAGRLTRPDEIQLRPIVARAGAPGAVCIASWYNTGEVTATGAPFDPRELAAASKTIAFGTRVIVTELIHQRSVVVRINDRGPYIDGRCIDLTPAAFSLIAPLEMGLLPVRVEVLERPVLFQDVVVSN